MRLGDLYGFIGFHAYAGSAEEGAASESFVFSIPRRVGIHLPKAAPAGTLSEFARRKSYDTLQNLWPARSGTDNGFDAPDVIDGPCRRSCVCGEYGDGRKR